MYYHSFAVTQMKLETYYNRATHLYIKSNCRGEVLQAIDVSFATCKFLCDANPKCTTFAMNKEIDAHCSLHTNCTVKDNGMIEPTANIAIYRKDKKINEQEEVANISLNYELVKPNR